MLPFPSQVAEGTAFFNSALERLTAIHERTVDLTTARALEREDLASQLQAEALAHASAAPPAVPPLDSLPSFGTAMAMDSGGGGAPMPPPSPVAEEPSVDPASLKSLMEMGFSRDQARAATPRRGRRTISPRPSSPRAPPLPGSPFRRTARWSSATATWAPL